MKFLNEIDGANKLKQDSSNRLVTDVEKASWNSKAEGNHNHSKNEITDFPTSLPASGGQSTTTKHLVGDDTRSVNSPPSVYMSSGSRWAGRAGWQTEFKYRSTIGSPSSLSGTYVYLQTHTPWSDPSGGYPVQIAYGKGAPSWRVGVSNSTWSDWESFNDNGNAATVNGKTVLTDVPSNAKFTDTNTTYSEITTAEIDAGTASTLRVITGRRIKYILDKVYSMVSTAIGALNKSNVGLDNVDNTADSTKNVLSATKLTTARTINEVFFDGTSNIIIEDSTKEPKFTKNTAFNKNFGTTAGTVAQGNDVRLSDARTPLAHNHNTIYNTKAEVDTKISNLDNKIIEVDTKIDTKLDTSALTFVEGGKTYLAKFAVENGIPVIIANEVI